MFTFVLLFCLISLFPFLFLLRIFLSQLLHRIVLPPLHFYLHSVSLFVYRAEFVPLRVLQLLFLILHLFLLFLLLLLFLVFPLPSPPALPPSLPPTLVTRLLHLSFSPLAPILSRLVSALTRGPAVFASCRLLRSSPQRRKRKGRGAVRSGKGK